MNNSINEEPQQFSSSVSVVNEEKNKALTAVSVSQVTKLTRPKEGLLIHGKKVNHVSIVAFVYEILDMNTQKIHILVDDFTSGGPLEVSHIIGDVGTPMEDSSLSMFNEQSENVIAENAADHSRPLSTLKPGDYIRCYGVVKFHQDKSNVVAFSIRIVDDPNEVTMHNLEVIRDSMHYERAQANNGVASILMDGGAAKVKSENNSANQYGNGGGNKNEFGLLSTRDKLLLKFLQEKGNDKGLTLAEIKKNFTAYRETDIKESLDTLTAEGMCWQGDYEDSWCAGDKDSI